MASLDLDPLQLIVPRRRGYRILGLSVSTGTRREFSDRTFPRAIQIGPNRFGFLLSELTEYAANLPRHEPDKRRQEIAVTAGEKSCAVRRAARAKRLKKKSSPAKR